MNGLKTLDISIVSLIILLVIYIHSYSHHEKAFTQHKMFNTMVFLNMGMIVVDILGWAFNGLAGMQNYILNAGFNLILYIAAPTVPSAWVLYVCFMSNSTERTVRRIRVILLALLAINAFVSVVSLTRGWFFSIDAANIYHRGPYFIVHVVYCELLLLFSFFFILTKRKLFQPRQFYSILIFFLAPLIGMVIQSLDYGVSYNWVGVTLSILIIYFYLQSRNLNTDFLTGVNNRMHFQEYIREKIKNTSEKKTFGAIMIDIDHFKKINDDFGHTVGDKALQDAVQIFRNALRRDDFIARFGGDEFLILLDVPTIEILESARDRLMVRTRQFNEQQIRPYQLDFSLGYDIYNPEISRDADDFIDHLDQLMYEDKRRKNLSVQVNRSSKK